MTNLSSFKCISAIIIWLLALFGGLFPIFAMKPHSLLNSCLNMCAGGVFLAGSFVHLLPDAMHNAPLAELHASFPWPAFFYGLGFLAMLILEVFVHSIKDTLHHSNLSPEDDQSPLTMLNNKKMRYDECNELQAVHSQIHNISDLSNDNPYLPFVVFIALSFHSLMEGIGIGAASSQPWSIVIAVLAHKSLAGMALSMELLQHKVRLAKLVLCLVIFASMTPIGIIFGWLFAGSDPAESMASGICTALAGGTFLYVGAMEIVPQEFQKRTHLGLKSAVLVASFFAFSSLSIWI
jgi:zinc transporter 1/2/3